MSEPGRISFSILGFLFCHSVILLARADEPAPTVTAPAVTIGVVLPADEEAARVLRLGVESALAELEREGSGPAPRVAWASVVRGGDGGDDAGAAWTGVTAGAAALRLVTEDRAAILIGPPGRQDAHLVAQIGGKTRTPVVATCTVRDVRYAGTPWQVFPESPGVRAAVLLAFRAIRVAGPEARGQDLLRLLKSRLR